MSQHQFEGILVIVKEDISKDKMNFIHPVISKDHLVVCLR